jgi:APA family basic amino acid/polyamine antiporter
MNHHKINPTIPLKRVLNKSMVTFYGLGTILGAGIYVLIAHVTTYAGAFMPFAFLIAALIAFFTAISYAELSSRYPKSAGEAYYVREAFKRQWLSGLIGWLVVLTGLVSASVLSIAFAHYCMIFIKLPPWLLISTFILSMTALAIWGISESMRFILYVTLLEIAGLLWIIFAGFPHFSVLPALWKTAALEPSLYWGTIAGAFIAFYAFVGIEDMVNIAEEVKTPEQTLPSSILWALIITTLLYFLVACSVIAVLPVQALASSKAPLALFIHAKGYPAGIIAFIGLIAITNGALAQIIMASRILYGMAKQNNAPSIFSAVSPNSQTPVIASITVMIAVLILSLSIHIEKLAQLTSSIILFVFIMMHLSLIVIKIKKPNVKKHTKTYPIILPITGLILSISFLGLQLYYFKFVY